MAGSLASAWSSPLPSLLPVATPPAAKDDRESSEAGPVAVLPPPPPAVQYGFGSPLNTHKEAKYFMHFIRNLASWFDTCDPARHFGIEVPKRAHHLPLLAYSILAFSARQLSLTTGVDDGSHSSYYSHALRILIPIFDDPNEAMNENVLAGIVILRSYEEMFGNGELLISNHDPMLTRVRGRRQHPPHRQLSPPQLRIPIHRPGRSRRGCELGCAPPRPLRVLDQVIAAAD
ncbi:zn 2cys6 transcription factor [Ilyonectria robusta]